MLFLERLLHNCQRDPSKPAIAYGSTPDSPVLSYEMLLDSVARTASWLADQGIADGDRVAVFLPKSLAGVQIHLAACSMGAISLPVNAFYTFPELQHLVQDSEAAVVILREDAKLFLEARGLHKRLQTRLVGIDPIGFAEQLPAASGSLSAADLPGGDQLALMLYTSGTTGRPKGACMTHASLTANMDMLDEAWQWSAQDVLLHALPIFHVHGLLVALHGALHAGATCVMHDAFKPQLIIKDLVAPRFSVFMAVPTMYRRILAALGDERLDLSHMRLLTSGSDRLPVEVFESIERQLGHRVVERYGMTETGIMLSNPVDGRRVAGQVGIPLPGVSMRIVCPETGAECIEGEVGELITRGPHVFSSYWRAPEKTKESFTEDGWFRTGDLGLRDSHGRFELKSRMTDLIISGGFNVYPTEVEHVLARHPGVRQCAVAGVPDGDWGEAVTAFVVPKHEDLLESELIRHCRESLAAYKTPKQVEFHEELPRNSMGKVRKQELVTGFMARAILQRWRDDPSSM